MSPQSIFVVLGGVFVVVGIVLRFVARPFVKLNLWWQELLARALSLKWLDGFMVKDEYVLLVMVRTLGTAFILIGTGLAFASWFFASNG
jgi:hypothetical protein